MLGSNYRSPDKIVWQGRPDLPSGSCFFQCIQLLDINKKLPAIYDDITFALVGFCCDEGIQRNFGRQGALDGPPAIRHALAKLPLQRQAITCYDAGDVICHHHDLENAQKILFFWVL